ncbi:MAG: ABC transporter permease [Alphaproteobacteria bacterium]|nr:ABC transporter permease [Alphaproteobacteria bacterium]
MHLTDIISEAKVSILSHRLRYILTILGVVIGVMAVVIMIAVGETVDHHINNHFSDLGTNTIMVRAGAATRGNVHVGTVTTLTIDDAEYISALPGIQSITPAQMASAQLVYGNKNIHSVIIGAYPDYRDVLSTQIQYGRFIDDIDIRNHTLHAIIGPRAAEELGLPQNSVGYTLRIKNIPFTIIGVMRPRGDTALGSMDDMVIVPLGTLKRRINGDSFINSIPVIGIRLFPYADNDIVIEQIKTILRMRHRLRDNDADDFQIFDMRQIMESLNRITGNMKILIITVASVSLLVGAIGIMNMMLVAVVERRREIGIRRAVGACARHIAFQFLMESVFISSCGAVIGLILGIGITQFVGRIILGMYVPFSFIAIIVSGAIAITCGIASGIFPAMRAADLSPIDCMRRE